MEIDHMGRRVSLNPEKPTEAGQGCVLFGKTIQKAIGRKDGRLDISFTDGSTLVVPSDPKYEAWEASADDGFLVVSVPGGGLTTWSAKAKTKG